MTEGTFSRLEIDSSPESLYDVAADVGAYPEWASGVKEVEILQNDSDGRVDKARLVLDIGIKEIQYVLQYTHDRPHTLSWVAEESDDLKSLEGSYQFTRKDDATEVIYSLAVEPNFTFPGFLRRQAEKQIVTTALRGLRKRVAEGN